MSFIERFIIQYPCYGGWFNCISCMYVGERGAQAGGGGGGGGGGEGESQDDPNNSVSPICNEGTFSANTQRVACSVLLLSMQDSTKASDAHILATCLWSFTWLLNQRFLIGFHNSLNALAGKLHICMSSW